MTPDKQFLASLHRITSCRQLGTLNLTIWNGTIEARHIIFDEMHVLGKWPLPAPGQQGKYCTCMPPVDAWPMSCLHGRRSTTTATMF